jgi:outer membrane lipoprotein SlyB
MRLLLAAALLVVVAGCANTPRQDDERYGTVESVRAVRLADNKGAEGIFAGAAIGSVLGEAIGGGGIAATLLGAVGGGVAGHELGRSATDHDGQEIVIRLDSGGTLTAVQPGFEDFAPRQRVRVRGRMIFHQ